jgi:sialate O-acetylesterase
MTDSFSNISLLIAEEKRQDLAAKAAGRPVLDHPWHPDLTVWAPGGLFNGMIAPETAYSIKGVIWYQGESNSDVAIASMYQRVFSTLIADWRAKWHEGNFPFLFVQLSSFAPSASDHQDWGLIREAQRRTLLLANTAMAVSLDVGLADNVHPPDKETVGHRLALAARYFAYHEPIEFSGPLFRRAVTEGSSMRVWFDHDKGLTTSTTDVHGFEIAGFDHLFVPATAHLVDGSVVVSSPQVPDPKYVRYGWANYAVTSLVNGVGLPASTFTSEDKLFVTMPPQVRF